jgi:hypothetical protein
MNENFLKEIFHQKKERKYNSENCLKFGSEGRQILFFTNLWAQGENIVTP